jgi:hypothetical protein
MPGTCPTCGAGLRGRTICPSCGTLVGLEAQIARARSGVRSFVDERMRALPRHLGLAHVLWACALMPMFILPPLVSLAYALRTMRGSRPAVVNTEWLAIISILNIVLAVAIWIKFHGVASDIIVAAFSEVQARISAVLGLPGPPGSGRSRDIRI